MIHWFNNQAWFGVGANWIQYTTIFTWAAVLWTLWHRRCHEPFCVRPGEIPVKGTHHKVCKRHAKVNGHVH